MTVNLKAGLCYTQAGFRIAAKDYLLRIKLLSR